jgi:hypothetical protein
VAELHPLCCHCDTCLNGAGGYTLPGAGRTSPTPSDQRRRFRGRSLPTQRAELLELEEQTRQRLQTIREGLRRLDAREASHG